MVDLNTGQKLKRVIGIGGATLMIAASALAETATYTVRDGDTLFKIARTELGDVAQWKRIAELNGISSPYTIRVGQELALGRESDSPTAPARQAEDEGALRPLRSIESDQPHSSPIQTEEPTLPASLKLDFIPAYLADPAVLVRSSIATSPRLMRKRAEITGAASKVDYAGALPDPKLMALLQNVSIDEITVGDQNAQMSMAGGEITQAIPNGRKRSSDEKIAAAQVVEKRAQLIALESSVAADVRRALVDLYRIEQQASGLALMRENYRSLEQSLTALYAVGEAAQSDILRVQAEITRLTRQLSELEAERAAAAASVAALAGVSRDRIGAVDQLHWAHAIDISAVKTDVLSDAWIGRAPRVLQAEAESEIARAKVERAEAEFRSDWSFTGGYFDRGSLDPIVRVGVGISLPVRTRSRQTPMLEEALAGVDAADAAREDAILEVRRIWEELVAAHRQGVFQVQLIEETLLPQARLAFESTLSRYRVGASPFENVIQALLTLERVELDFIMIESHHAKHIIRFAELFGIPPGAPSANDDAYSSTEVR